MSFNRSLQGSSHSNCNLNYKNSYFIPIVFYNLSGYGSHFIIKEIATANEDSIDLLKKNIYHLQKKIPLKDQIREIT